MCVSSLGLVNPSDPRNTNGYQTPSIEDNSLILPTLNTQPTIQFSVHTIMHITTQSISKTPTNKQVTHHSPTNTPSSLSPSPILTTTGTRTPLAATSTSPASVSPGPSPSAPCPETKNRRPRHARCSAWLKSSVSSTSWTRSPDASPLSVGGARAAQMW